MMVYQNVNSLFSISDGIKFDTYRMAQLLNQMEINYFMNEPNALPTAKRRRINCNPQ